MSLAPPETSETGVLCVASAFPDPPFEVAMGGAPAGFDVPLMQALAADLGLTWRVQRFEGDGIFAGLGRDWDCVAPPEHLRRSLGAGVSLYVVLAEA